MPLASIPGGYGQSPKISDLSDNSNQAVVQVLKMADTESRLPINLEKQQQEMNFLELDRCHRRLGSQCHQICSRPLSSSEKHSEE